MSEPTLPPASSDDKIWIILCHLSLVIGVGVLLPLIVWLMKKQDSPVTAAHAKEALLFHISVYIYGIVSFFLIFVFIGIILLPAVSIFALVCAIIACVKASEGGFYRYPLTIRFF